MADLWLCLHLPRCALEALARYLPPGGAPTAVVASERGRRRIVVADQQAAALGVEAGQMLTAARAQVPALVAWERDRDAETALLRRLAARCLAYTSHVHWPEGPPEPGAGRLLLEIGASLRLFGGRKALIERVHADLAIDRHTVAIAAGRTPTLAMLRARAACYGYAATATRALPLGLLELPLSTLESLRAAGLTTTADVLALPRAGLARRYGPQCLDVLDRLTGRRADPRPALAPPRRFVHKLELPEEIDNVQALAFPLQRLLEELAAMLRAADAAIAALTLTLGHASARPTRLVLDFAAPSRDAGRMRALLDERLASLQLPEPVRNLHLASGRFVAFVSSQLDLFEDRTRDAAAWHELLDRLRARLGEHAVSQPQCVPDHRPERASRRAPVAADPGTAITGGRRPIWLLDPARPLARPPQVLQGPERIESGWWEHDQRRDYYLARDEAGRRLWVYREARAPHRWFWHGVFG